MSDGSPVHPLELLEIDRKKYPVNVTERRQREDAGGRYDAFFILHFSSSATKNAKLCSSTHVACFLTVC